MYIKCFSFHCRGSILLLLCSHSAVPNSLRPLGLQPARSPCSWGSLSKNTGVDCHYLLSKVSQRQSINNNIYLLGIYHMPGAFCFKLRQSFLKLCEVRMIRIWRLKTFHLTAFFQLEFQWRSTDSNLVQLHGSASHGIIFWKLLTFAYTLER